MARTWLPTLCIAVMVAAGTWIARDFVPSKQALVANNGDSEAPSKEEDTAVHPSMDTEIDIDIDIPDDVNRLKGADLKPKLGVPKDLPAGTDEQAKPLGMVELPQDQTKAKTVVAHLKVDGSTDTDPSAKAARPPGPLAVPKKPKIALPTTYLVKQRDSFWFIAQQHYGNPLYYRALYQFNRGKIKQPDRMSVGSLVSIPTVAQLRASFPQLCPRNPDK